MERRGPVLLRWFVSYLAILLIPLLFSGIVYLYSLHIINKSSQEIYEASLEQFRIEMDNFISGTFQALQQLNLNSSIKVLSLVRDELDPHDRWNMVLAIREIQKVQVIVPLIDDVFVVLNPLESVMASGGYYFLDFFYSFYFQDEAVSFEDFKTLLNAPRRNEIVPVQDKLLMFQASTEGFTGNSSATLAISYRKELFENRYLNSYEANGCRIFISREGDFLISTNKTATPFISGNTGIIGNVKYRVLSVDSHEINCTYHYFIPENLEKARARQIQVFTFIGLFICTMLGIFLSFVLSKRNYDPVRKLMAVFSPQEKMKEGEDEFRWIERRAMDTQRALGVNLETLRKYFIRTLLEKPFDPVSGKREMERYGVRLEGEWNMAAVFMIPDFPAGDRVLSESEGDIISSLQYVVAHIFTEAAAKDFAVEMISIGEHVAAIVNWSGNKDAFISRLEDKIEYTQQEAGEFLHFQVLTSLGEPRRGPEGIYYSWLEALEASAYLDSKTGQTILHYHDIKHSGRGYQYTQETEQKLINLVRAGDGEAAGVLLHQVWNENNNTPGISTRTGKLLAYNLLGSLIKGTEQASPPEDLLFRAFNLEYIPANEQIDVLEKAAREICQSNFLVRQARPDRQLSGKVKKYIEENYKNPDVNISITGYHFKMNPAYLAAVFREETGTSLLEYINILRIEEGKRLLASGKEVNEAAGLCGFRGSNAFIRVFKKLTGITPGQYLEL